MQVQFESGEKLLNGVQTALAFPVSVNDEPTTFWQLADFEAHDRDVAKLVKALAAHPEPIEKQNAIELIESTLKQAESAWIRVLPGDRVINHVADFLG